MKTVNRTVAAAAIGWATLGLPALADDAKLYPGSGCRALVSSAPVAVNGNGAIRNGGASTVSIECPVVRDIDAGRIKGALVRLIDLHPTQDVFCSLRTLRSDGGLQQEQSLRSSGSSLATQALNFGPQAAITGGLYVLNCSLPPNGGEAGGGISSIAMYRVVEGT